MKNLLLLFLLPLLLFSCNSQSASKETSESAEITDKAEEVEMERTTWANQHLIGKVKSIEEMPYTPDEEGNIGEMDSCCVELKEMNDKGFLIKVTEKTREGALAAIETVERTETGRFLSMTKKENGEEVKKMVSTYDEEGNHLYTTDSDSTKNVVYYYDNITFNDYNQPLSGDMSTVDSTFMGVWSWKYIDGYRTGRSWVDSTNVKRFDRTGEVNDKGWISEAVVVRVDEEGDTTTTIETYTYDSFDEMGNWTQRTEMKDGEPVEVLKRSYTYFEE